MVWLQTEIWYAMNHTWSYLIISPIIYGIWLCLGNLKMGGLPTGLPPIDGYNRCYSNIDNDAKESDFRVHFQTHLFWTESCVKCTKGEGAGKSGNKRNWPRITYLQRIRKLQSSNHINKCMNASCRNENTLTRHLVAWQSNKLTFTEFMILPDSRSSHVVMSL